MLNIRQHSITPRIIFAVGHSAEGRFTVEYFVVRTFCRRTFRRGTFHRRIFRCKDVLPYELHVLNKSHRKSSSLYRFFAVRTFRRRKFRCVFFFKVVGGKYVRVIYINIQFVHYLPVLTWSTQDWIYPSRDLYERCSQDN